MNKSEIMKLRWKNKDWRNYMSSRLIGNKLGLGYRHTKEEIKEIQQASKKLWQEKWYREKMMKVCKKSNEGQFKKGFTPWNKGKKLSEGREGKEFYRGTRRRIKKEKCAWCGSNKNLEYDHIIAIGKNGTNDDSNCQILCKKCNLFKRNTIDYPEYFHEFNAKQANSVKPLTGKAEGNAELNS